MIWPKHIVEKLTTTKHQFERIYTGDYAPEVVVFGDRPLWTATYDWPPLEPDKAEILRAEIVGNLGAGIWDLFIPADYPDVLGTAYENTTGVNVFSSFGDDYLVLKTTDLLNYVKPGRVMQVGYYVLSVVSVDPNTRKVEIENMPEALVVLTAPERNALTVKLAVDNRNRNRGSDQNMTIIAQLDGANPPALERRNDGLIRIHPVTIREQMTPLDAGL